MLFFVVVLLCCFGVFVGFFRVIFLGLSLRCCAFVLFRFFFFFSLPISGLVVFQLDTPCLSCKKKRGSRVDTVCLLIFAEFCLVVCSLSKWRLTTRTRKKLRGRGAQFHVTCAYSISLQGSVSMKETV